MADESMSADKHWGGVCCKGKGWRDGGEHKGGKNQEDEERADGMCPGCGGEEEIISSIQENQKKEMISCSIVYVCSKEEICLGMDDPISNLPEK